MESRHLFTFASVTQSQDLFKGSFLKGYHQPRIAWVGRSNVGKSSLINSILGARLAQTSNQPGKTRAIHFYLWSQGGKILADLPGFGYARASKSERLNWEEFIMAYFKEDTGLEQAVMLLDARHGPTEIDQGAIEFLSLKNIPVTFVFTKVDALKTQSQRALRQKEATLALEKLGIRSVAAGSPNSVFWVSSHKKIGLKPLIQHLKGQF